MSTDTEKQFAGNYVRLVNKSRSLEQDVILKNRIIKLMSGTIYDNHFMKSLTDMDKITEEYKKLAVIELVAEQNKKAADNASI